MNLVKNSNEITSTEKAFDTTKGVFFEYPIEFKEDYLKIDEKIIHHITMNKILTKDDIVYILDYSSSDGKFYKTEIPIGMYGVDEISLQPKIDANFEKKFGENSSLNFVVSFWDRKVHYNYEYQIDYTGQLSLKSIYRYINNPKMIIVKGRKDTISFYTKFEINKLIDLKKIRTITEFNESDDFKKTEKWDIE